MKVACISSMVCLLFGASVACAADDDITVACYYFGNYHPNDARNRKQKGEGWSEWELVKQAKPRFEGHQQPKVPLWGYTDESDPKEMERKIDAAANHGIDAFIFDWYYYDDGPFLEKPIDEAFLQARNNSRVKFALMWANHDWKDIHPYTRDQKQEYGHFGYPFMNTISDNTPARFQKALALTKERLLEDDDGPRILNINCWNEWTEGSYLEPDTTHGMAYLEAVKAVFGPNGKTTQ